MPPFLKSLRRAAADTVREIRLRRRIAAMPAGGGPKVAFLPSAGRFGSALLRSYAFAEALEARGWRTIVAPASFSQARRMRILKAFGPDLLALQASRLALNDPDLLPAGAPFVYDIDDADFLDPALADRMARTCAQARAVTAGSRYVASWCAAHCADVSVLWTGTQRTAGPRPLHCDRAPILTWAQAAPFRYPKEFAFVETIALALQARLEDGLTLRLYGWGGAADPALLARMKAAGVRIELIPTLGYEAFLTSLREAAVGLSPIIAEDSPFSRGKSFGKILGYLDAKKPVIASDHADHSAFFTEETGVISNDPDVWIAAAEALLRDPERRQRMADAAEAALERSLTIDAATDGMETVLRRALAR
jgi:hypothetical protein